MSKNKVKKLLIFTLAFLVVCCMSLTYIYTGNFRIGSFVKSTMIMLSPEEEKVFDRKYITSNQDIIVREPNGVGTVSHDYLLPLDYQRGKVTSISFDFDNTKSSVGNIALNITTDSDTKTFEISNTSIRDCSKLVMVGLDCVKEISVTSRYDAYGGSEISNEEIVSLISVKINNEDDISVLNRQLLIDLIKSIVISAAILLVVFFILNSKVDSYIFKDKFSIEKIFFITAIVVGLVFSVLIPIYQVPDEQTHINIIYEELNWDVNIKTQSDISDFADTSRIIRNYDEKVNLSTYLNFEAKSPLPSSVAFPSLRIIRHLPQAIGFVFATLIRLPLWFCVLIAEIFAMVAYAIFGYLTLKIMPFKKEIMTVIMLLPICLQETSSLSYDSFLLSSYFLLFAYILYVKFTKEKFTLFDVFIILLLTFVVAVTKIPYALVVGLVLIIPIKKIDFNFGLFRLKGDFIIKHKIIFGIVAVICLIIGFIFAIKILPYIGESKTFLAALQAKRATIRIILATVKEYFGEWLVQITGKLGWFDTPVALIFTVFVIANLLFINLFDFNNKSGSATITPFKILEIVLFIVVAVAMFCVTILSMFGWTMQAYGIDVDEISISQTAEYMKSIPIIGGLQGRYFVPIIPMLLIPCHFPKISSYISKINHNTYLCGYHLITFIYLVVILLNRYWI